MSDGGKREGPLGWMEGKNVRGKGTKKLREKEGTPIVELKFLPGLVRAAQGKREKAQWSHQQLRRNVGNARSTNVYICTSVPALEKGTHE